MEKEEECVEDVRGKEKPHEAVTRKVLALLSRSRSPAVDPSIVRRPLNFRSLSGAMKRSVE